MIINQEQHNNNKGFLSGFFCKIVVRTSCIVEDNGNVDDDFVDNDNDVLL